MDKRFKKEEELNLPEPVKRELEIRHHPDSVKEHGLVAARKIKELIDTLPNPVMIKGKKYVEFSEWQILGNYFDVAVKTYEVEPVERWGSQGVKARAEAIYTPTGEVVGAAESICLRSEKGRANHDYNKISSMAQTRAGSKALRNALGWVLKLAGLPQTPAEEMVDFGEQSKKQSKKSNTGAPGTNKQEEQKTPRGYSQESTETKEETQEVAEAEPEAIDAEYTVKDKSENEDGAKDPTPAPEKSNTTDPVTKARIVLEAINDELREEKLPVKTINQLKKADGRYRNHEFDSEVFKEIKREIGMRVR